MRRNLTIVVTLLTITFLFPPCLAISKQKGTSYVQSQEGGNPLTFLSVKDNKIVNEYGKEVLLRGFHFDCFNILGKTLHDALISFGSDPDDTNIELSRYYFSEYDITQFKHMGANVVRIGIRLWQIERRPYIYSEKALKHLDTIITKWGNNGIYVILDLHAAGQNSLPHNREYGNILWDDESFQNRVVALWEALANRYRDNPYVAGYDIINEPQAPTKVALREFYQRTIKKIRQTDKKHIIFIERNLFQRNIIQFGGEYDDHNIVSSLHFYEPHKFTMQGRKGIPLGSKYPGTYRGRFWDKSTISQYFETAINDIKGRPLFVGEFSAAVWSGGNDALQWNKDVLDVFNNMGIHYTFFAYKFSRGTHGLYVPRKDIHEQIRALRNRILKQQIRITDVKRRDKELLLTKNYEYSTKLKQLIKKNLARRFLLRLSLITKKETL